MYSRNRKKADIINDILILADITPLRGPNQQEMENHRDRPEIAAALEQGKGRAVRWSVTSSLHTLYYAERLEQGDVLRVGKDSENFFRILEHTSALVMVLAW